VVTKVTVKKEAALIKTKKIRVAIRVTATVM